MATTFTVTSSNIIVPYRLTRNASIEEGSAQTYKYGALLVLSGGQAVKGASDPAANTILGIASEDATGVQASKVGYYAATEDAEFLGTVQDTGTLALALIGTQVGLVYDATNDIFRVDLSDTTNKRVTITRLYDAVGDVNGRVVFKFMNAARTPFWS